MQRSGLMFLMILVFFSAAVVQGQHYPIYFIGGNFGFGSNDLANAAAIKGFLRYSVAADIPGLQFEASYSTHLFKNISEQETPYNENGVAGTYVSAVKIRDHQLALSLAFHLRPFGKGAYFYFGGGGNLNFIGMDSTVTDKYWDPIGATEQEKQLEPVQLLRQVLPGYHAYGGIRIAFNTRFLDSFDVEVRKVFFPEGPSEWKDEKAAQTYRDKKWDSWSLSAGLTFCIW